MIIKENHQLKELNTFGIAAYSKFFTEVASKEHLEEIIQHKSYKSTPKMILGGGSNILFTQDYDGLIIKNDIKGIEKIKEDDTYYWIKAYAGENWHDLVMYCVDHNYAGIENLSLIPGKVGAAPMQNIGAYGVELKDVFEELEAINIADGKMEIFKKKDCEFGYRSSVFKTKLKGLFCIYSVTLKLLKKPQFNISYGAIESTLDDMNIYILNIKAISDAVIKIRESKLPNPKIIGNAGSFFKNPEIPTDQYKQLQKAFPDIVGYPLPNGTTKVAAGWLIEQCGWKGKKVGHTGTHKNQALVLVNYGGAEGKEVYQLAIDIQKSVQDKFGIEITPEVNLI